MAQQKQSSHGALRDTLRSGSDSIRTALSQLVTRKKPAEAPESPALPRPVPEGPRWGHLVLMEKVGQGAFGEVHRAWDITLEREVALKLMRAASEDPALLQEARMLARVRHPNVVTVYGADTYEGRSGVWMDFIEGQTLEALLEERGAFAASEALLIGVDVCRALAAVHQRGLLHRDIKAQNVMRERGGRIVLMDFGLGHETGGGAAAGFGGTPPYMAPELFEDEPATGRTDLYAVGVLLFHLATRAFPVDAATVGEFQAAHRARAPLTLRDLRPELPAPFVRAVEKALAPEPGRRYATGGQMTAELEAALGVRRLSPMLTRRALWWSTPPLAAVGAGAGWYLWQHPGASVRAGASLLLSEISNATGDPQLIAVADVLRVQIAQSAHFNVLDSDRVKQTLAQMTKPADQKLDLPVAREVALRSGTPLLVYGTLSPLGAGYGLSMMIERIEGQPHTPRATESKLFEARNKNALFDAIHQAAIWIRKTAGETAKDILDKDTQPEEATTNSWEALDYFSRGERLNEQNRWQDAVSMYKQAVLKDPGFALPLARIAQLQATLLHNAESFTYWRRAVQALDARHVTRREEYRIRSLHANVTQNYAAAEGLTGAWVLAYPADWLGHHYRALALRNLAQLTEARRELIASQRLRPAQVNIMNLIRVDLLLGEYQEATSYARDLRPGFAEFYRGFSKVLAGNFEGAEADFASVLSANDARLRSMATKIRAYLLAERGRQREAATVLGEGIAQDSAAGDFSVMARKLVAMAHLELIAGRIDSARNLALRAAREDSDTISQLLAGTVLARAGFSADARSLLSRLNAPDEGPRFETARAILTAETCFAEGHAKEALASLEDADRLAPLIHPRDFLAHGLERAGRLDDALAAWRRIVDAPALLWTRINDDSYDPGLWTEALLHVGELASRARRPVDARAALDRFLKIREHADPDDPQSAAARKLLLAL